MHRRNGFAFCAALLLVAGPAAAADSDSGLPPSVGFLDADHDGRLSLAEALHGAELRFPALDADHNGRLDKAEAAAAHVHSKGFRRADADGDRGIDLGEYQKLVEVRFAAADANHDGKIDAAELRRKKGKALRRMIEAPAAAPGAAPNAAPARP